MLKEGGDIMIFEFEAGEFQSNIERPVIINVPPELSDIDIIPGYIQIVFEKLFVLNNCFVPILENKSLTDSSYIPESSDDDL